MIKIIDGNLFDSEANIIGHQCNCQGVMGSGVAAEARHRYPNVFEAYRKDYINGKLKLGYVCFATAKTDQVIANMCAQNIFGYDGGIYTNYEALQKCLDTVKEYATFEYDVKPVIAFPYLMSCYRGGGDWNIVYKMIEDTFTDFDVEIWRFDNG